MQKITHNGIEYTTEEFRQAWFDGVVSHEDYMNHFEQIRMRDRREYVQGEYDFTDEQMESFTDEQVNMMYESYEAYNEIDELRYQLEEFINWADDRPCY